MKEKVASGEAISVHDRPLMQCYNDAPDDFPTVDHAYLLEEFVVGIDYCNTVEGRWIWSIGESKATGRIYAAHDNRFYDHSKYICLFLR